MEVPEDAERLRLLSHVFRIAYDSLDKARNSSILFDEGMDSIDGPKQEGQYRANPFDRFNRQVENAFSEARADLIKEIARRLNEALTPNLKEDREEWKKLMDGWVGEEGFEFPPLLDYFAKAAQDTEGLRLASLARLRELAEKLVPWGERPDLKDEAGYARRGPVVKREGRLLLLRSHCWHEIMNGRGYVSFSDTEPLEAFDILVQVALNGRDPATYHAPGYITTHARNKHNEPEAEFFAKQRTPTAFYESFQFFKNGALKVYFKTEEDAKRVEAVLMGADYVGNLTTVPDPMSPTLGGEGSA